ncbi:hypothetical protein BJF78_27485 [Pseudonocardia sp. CNS-139]|nr:hypothetical protein BJF78_27485 [Pseudonocardia sp. CNS-139]
MGVRRGPRPRCAVPFEPDGTGRRCARPVNRARSPMSGPRSSAASRPGVPFASPAWNRASLGLAIAGSGAPFHRCRSRSAGSGQSGSSGRCRTVSAAPSVCWYASPPPGTSTAPAPGTTPTRRSCTPSITPGGMGPPSRASTTGTSGRGSSRSVHATAWAPDSATWRSGTTRPTGP